MLALARTHTCSTYPTKLESDGTQFFDCLLGKIVYTHEECFFFYFVFLIYEYLSSGRVVKSLQYVFIFLFIFFFLIFYTHEECNTFCYFYFVFFFYFVYTHREWNIFFLFCFVFILIVYTHEECHTLFFLFCFSYL